MDYRVKPPLTSKELNKLFTRVWEEHTQADLTSVLDRSLTYVCAYDGDELVGYVNVAWDGGEHAFLLDTAVDRSMRHQGIGTALVERAIADTRTRGLKWLHVDFEPHLTEFYRSVGFRETAAGLVRLND